MQDNVSSQELTTEEKVFQDTYDTTLQFLETRYDLTNMNIADIEGELHHLTIYEGQDWAGRGELKNSEIQAQIYAYIAFIENLKKQQQEETNKA